MPFLGTIAKNLPFTFEVDTQAKVATTWYWLKPGRIVDLQGLVNDTTTGPVEVRSPAQAGRLVIEASATPNTIGVIRLTQGDMTIDVGVAPDAIIQIDLA